MKDVPLLSPLRYPGSKRGLVGYIKQALELNPQNVRAYELQLDIVRRRHPNGGIAGTFNVPAFEYTT